MAQKAYDPSVEWLALPLVAGKTRVVQARRIIEFSATESGTSVKLHGHDNPYPEDVEIAEPIDGFKERFFEALRASYMALGTNAVCSPRF